MRQNIIKLFLTVLFITVLNGAVWGARIYSLVPLLNIRETASLDAKIISTLRHSRWVNAMSKTGEWIQIKLPGGQTGYVFAHLTTDFWIKILKDERKIMLMKDDKALREFPMALGLNPKDDKIREGDRCTPEGRFYICEVTRNPQPPSTYGPVSLRISYPNIEDARRGLMNKLITMERYLAIVQSIDKGVMPPQNTILGSSIKIHGGDAGVSSDWTWGCIAVRNPELETLVAWLPAGLVLVEIYRSREKDRLYNEENYVNRRLVIESQELLDKGCTYTKEAKEIIPLSYPMGDFDNSIGVCTDLPIRALRGLGIDLQALVYEDITLHADNYPGIPTPDPNIDHRRTHTLRIYFENNTVVLSSAPPDKNSTGWLPGDIVILDTGIDNGTIYDHIGIVSTRKNVAGIPLVFNLWTTGNQLNEMDLLNGDYPKIIGHYRLLHPFFYDAFSAGNQPF